MHQKGDFISVNGEYTTFRRHLYLCINSRKNPSDLGGEHRGYSLSNNKGEVMLVSFLA